MNEEEKKAIEYLKNLDMDLNTLMRISLNELDLVTKIILNLIEKQQKEIANKDRQIDLMVKYILNQDIEEDICKNLHCANVKNCRECIKQYFKNKVEEDK